MGASIPTAIIIDIGIGIIIGIGININKGADFSLCIEIIIVKNIGHGKDKK